MENSKVLMVGQFPPLITGEGMANEAVFRILTEAGVAVKVVDSCIINTVSDVGELSINKIFSATLVIVKSIFYLFKADLVYMTPGQTYFGILRFLPIIFMALLLRKKVYLHWHGYGIQGLVNKHPYLKRLLFRSSIKHFLLTSDLKDKLKRAGCIMDQASVISNYFSASKLTGSASRVNGNKLNVLYLGGLMEEKGILEFIKAAEISSDFNFIVCGKGGGGIMDKLKMADKKGTLSFRGMTLGKDKDKVFLESGIFVLQTHHPTEGVPLTIIEAMAAGCAVITTQHNGIPETVGEAALYVDKRSSYSLLMALNSLKDDHKKLTELQEASLVQSSLYTFDKFKVNVLKGLSLGSLE